MQLTARPAGSLFFSAHWADAAERSLLYGEKRALCLPHAFPVARLHCSFERWSSAWRRSAPCVVRYWRAFFARVPDRRIRTEPREPPGGPAKSLGRPAFGFGSLLALLLALPLLAFARAQEVATPAAGPAGTPCPAGSPAAEGTPVNATPAVVGTPDATPAASPAPACEEADASTGTTIRIVDFGFEPAQTEVKVGTTLTWINEGDAPHTSTAYVDGTKYWDSNILETGQSYAFTLNESGFFDYLCTLHPNMTASLNVVE